MTFTAKLTTYVCGCKEWRNAAGKFHRLDGPAWIPCAFCGGPSFYWIDGIRFKSKEEHTEVAESYVKKAFDEILRMLIECWVWTIVTKDESYKYRIKPLDRKYADLLEICFGSFCDAYPKEILDKIDNLLEEKGLD